MILSVVIKSTRSVTEEQWAELREAILTLPAVKPDYMWQPVMVDDDGLRAIARLGLQIELRDDEKAHTMLVKLQNRLKALEIKSDELAKACAAGAAVQISLPNIGLLSIDEVDHLDNACTDELQSYLKDGWRILAVCPQNAQRRPDYIIGRRKRD